MNRQKYYKYALPKELMIEPINLCDLKCPTCPSGNGRLYEWGVPRGVMTLSQFKKIIDQTRDFIDSLVLWGLGEPTLVVSIDKMIKYASSRGISVVTSTHGNNLNAAMIEKLIESGLFRIIFSIDGLSQETYGKFRLGGDCERAFDNLKEFVKTKKRKKSRAPLICWQFIVMNHNEYEIPKLAGCAKRIGVDELWIKKFPPSASKFAPRNLQYIRNEPKSVRECKFLKPGGRPMVFFNGDVSVCSHDFRMKYVMGNIFKESLVDIWNNDLYKKFRENFKKNLVPECVDCNAKSYVDHFIKYKFKQ